MKQLVIWMLMMVPMLTFGQRTMKDFLQENCPVVWFGLDFSKARMIGSEGFDDPVAIKEDFFEKWNNLMIEEGDKYDWGKALLVTDLKYDYEIVGRENDKVSVKTLVINKSYEVSEEDIASAVRAYRIDDYKDGIGVVVVVESFNKIKEQGFGHLTFFDIASRKVIYSHKLVGEAGSVGFRNHWARAIHNWLQYTKGRVMKDIKKQFK